ncbi:hypothetical protein QSV34_12875 [Porticoccus sp. W117]|uniref:hypothetical protein n=1 Tax=Porticoccus sp. W117 TaxID=3054777 RepID=UPI002592D3D4|nr:hypothetical protein [Porticoccus sp. W117]MDM3872241.1 hypothetical protein [Porticoccus sp. W117]
MAHRDCTLLTLRTIAKRAIPWLAFLVFPAMAAKTEKPSTVQPSTVQDLRYGTALYHYFQQDYQAALTELLIAEERGGIQNHGDAGELMRGGLNLALDMEPQASAVFERLIGSDTPEPVRNAAWFYLGKLRYQQGDWQGASQSLQRVNGDLPKAMADELQSLTINLAIKQQDYINAEQLFGQQTELTPWLPYIYYNLGTAHVREGNRELGVGYLDALADLELDSEEHRSLRDKALAASGYSMMLAENYQGAMDRFIQVRLHSPLIQRALLGYGWAAMELEQYPMALSAWQKLGEHSDFDASVQEALLAIPHVYEKLEAPGQALEAYLDAENSYTDQLVEVEQIADDLTSEQLLAALELVDSEDHSSLDLQRLADFLSLQPLQNRAVDVHRLLDMQDRLEQWQSKLDIFQHLLDQRRQARGDKLQTIEQRQFPVQLQQMMAHGDQRAAELQRIIDNNDAMALVDDDTKDLWQRVERSQQHLQVLTAAGELSAQEQDEYREILRRSRGLLKWRAMEQYPDNLWQRKKALRQFENQLLTAVENFRHLQDVIEQAPDIAPYQARLDALQQRLQGRQTAVAAALNQAEGEFRVAVLDELQRQRQRLRYYQSQARLALARLYDSGSQTAEVAP